MIIGVIDPNAVYFNQHLGTSLIEKLVLKNPQKKPSYTPNGGQNRLFGGNILHTKFNDVSSLNHQ